MEQTHQKIFIIAGDDASRDSTPEVVRQYEQKAYGKIHFKQYIENVGTILNFSRLGDYVDSNYIMLSDQDDIWLPSKVEKTLEKMKEMEAIYGSDTPLLVHTDLSVVDENLKMLHPSFWKYCMYNPNNTSLARVLTQNNVTGCTVMINRALLNLAFPIPAEAYMHEHWLYLVATAFGHVGCIEESTLYYRQHSSNAIGAYKRCDMKQIRSLFRDKHRVHVTTYQLYVKMVQAHAFYKRYSESLDSETKEILKKFITLKNDTFIEEIKTRFHYNFHRGGFYTEIYDLIASFLRGPIPEKYKLKV